MKNVNNNPLYSGLDFCLPVCPRIEKKGLYAFHCLLYLIDKYKHLDSRLRGNDKIGSEFEDHYTL